MTDDDDEIDYNEENKENGYQWKLKWWKSYTCTFVLLSIPVKSLEIPFIMYVFICTII